MIQLQEYEFKQILQLLYPIPTEQHQHQKESEQTILPEENLIQTSIEQNIFYLDELSEVKMTENAHLIFYSIVHADFILKMYKNRNTSLQTESAYFYAYNNTLVYIYKYNDLYQIHWLPHIPMAIGGVSSFLKRHNEQNSSFEIEGVINGKKEPDFKLTISTEDLIQTKTIHTIARWFIYQYSDYAKERSTNE